jgi:hypothetical protein
VVWALIVRRRVIGLAVVCVVMRLRVERVVAVVANAARSWVVIVVIVAASIWNILYRVLGLVSDCL